MAKGMTDWMWEHDETPDDSADMSEELSGFLGDCRCRWEAYIENLAIASGEDQDTEAPSVQWDAVEDRFEDWAHGFHPDDLYPDLAMADVIDEMGGDQALMALLTA